jgi:osmoprotectant transport system substrate-binding protein
MRPFRTLALGASLLVLLSACTTGGGSTTKPTIKVGSDGFNESQVVAEMYAQVLEAAGYTVQRNLGLGARAVTAPALESGQIDLKPEYIGSGTAFYDPTKAMADADATAAELQAILATKGGGITVLDYSPGEDFDAFAVRRDTAESLGLTMMSDLAAVQDDLTWGLPPECETNPLCRGALEDTYGINWPPKNLEQLAACDAPIAEALNGGAVDIAELCSTQAAIAQFDFVVLDDDQGTNPAQNLAPLVRDDFLAKLSESDRTAFRKLLNDVSARLTTEALQQVNIALNVDQKDVPDAAKEFLQANGLLPSS